MLMPEELGFLKYLRQAKVWCCLRLHASVTPTDTVIDTALVTLFGLYTAVFFMNCNRVQALCYHLT